MAYKLKQMEVDTGWTVGIPTELVAVAVAVAVLHPLYRVVVVVVGRNDMNRRRGSS